MHLLQSPMYLLVSMKCVKVGFLLIIGVWIDFKSVRSYECATWSSGLNLFVSSKCSLVVFVFKLEIPWIFSV